MLITPPEPKMLNEPLAPTASETETKLARLWADVLNREIVGINDDYFDLGGNSLLAVNLFARIESQFGTRLPLTSLIEAPTVAQLARVLDTRGSHNPVVLLRKGEDSSPLFLIHDADGETMLYRGLALRLDPAHTVYGLQPRSEANQPILHTSFEEMAKFHISNIRRIQPHGPYLLGGLCAGGLIAFEVARQLQRDGERVAMVALLDAADVAAKPVAMRIAKARLNNFASTFEHGKGGSKAGRAMKVMRTIVRKTGNLTKYLFQSRTEAIRNRARMRLFRAYLQLGLPLPAFLQDIPVRTAYTFARGRYRPATPFEGELTLFRATSGTGIDEPFKNRYSEPLMGWDRRATHGVRAFDIPGGHSSMLQEPNVRVVAEQMQAYINEVLKRTTSASAPVAQVQRGSAGEPAAANGAASPGVATTHAVVSTEERPGAESSGRSRPFHLLVVSAESRGAMEHSAEQLAAYLGSHDEQPLADVSYTLAVETRDYEWRRAVVGAGRDEVIERLRKGSGRGSWTGSEQAVDRPVAFILAGVGEQAAGVGRGLYEGEPAFRAAADHCAQVLRPLLGHDIRETMFTAPKEASNWLRGGGGNVLKDTRVAQPAAFVLDWALAQMWLSWGVKPAAVLGYSVGEYVAAVLADVLRLDDALEIVARRAAWIHDKAEPGVMLAVPLAEPDLRPRLGNDLWFAAINSPQATVVGGREPAIQRLEAELQLVGVVTRRVASEQGSHTPLLDSVRDDLSQLVETMWRGEPRVPVWSNVTGTWLTATDARDANYWCEHMCGPVRFEEGAGELLRNQEQILLEVGPGPGLGAMVRQHRNFGRERMGRVLASLPGAWDRATDREHVAGVLGRLWIEGARVDWAGYFATENRRLVALPSFPPESNVSAAEPQSSPIDPMAALSMAKSQ
jgi:thioesterase domain-containing protein/malonyl CoA-acyl carrier protein transacylase/acyl carrier protein